MKKRAFIILLLITNMAGCVSHRAIQNDLDNSMREWNKTLRAAQVIPIVPLVGEKGLEVGTIFLTPLTTNQEVDSWNNKDGLLEINNTYSKISDIQIQPNEFDVAIPTYSVNYNQRSGIGTKLNVHAIPLAAAYSSANDGNMAVTLSNVKAKGFDDWEMQNIIETWAQKDDVKLKLSKWYANEIKGVGDSKNPIILRFVSKIFTATSIYVVVKDDESNALKGQIGSSDTTSFGINSGTQAMPKPNTLPTTPAIPETNNNQGSSSDTNATTVDKTITDIDALLKLIDKKIATKTDVQETNIPTPIRTGSTDVKVAELEAKLKQTSDLVSISNQLNDLKKAQMLNQYGGYYQMGADVFRITHLGKSVSINQTFSNPMVFGYWALEYVLLKDGKLERINRNILNAYSNKETQKLISKITLDTTITPSPQTAPQK